MKTLLVFFLPVLALVCTAADTQTEYHSYFDPAKGFKPAQRDLTAAYLQAAASLEHFGSPEPYLRHMMAEHERIRKLARTGLGKNAQTCRPAHMSDEHIEKLIANWNRLSPVLGLDAVAKEIGEDVRNGIRGVWDKGTMAVMLLNEHQQQVLADMASGKSRAIGFQQLQARMIHALELDKTEINTSGYEASRRDPVRYADLANARLVELRSMLGKKLPQEKAEPIAEAVRGIFIELAAMVHSELEAGIQEWSLQ